MTKPRPRTKLIAASLLTLLILFLAEGALRLLGFQVYEPVHTQVHSNPKNNLIPHANYGLALNPGSFTVHLNEHLQYQATHLIDSTRACGSKNEGRKEIQVYGCSLTYGMGVNDKQTYPALLQEEFPDYRVKNFAVPGYGTVHSLLQLREQLRKGVRPEMVILGYASLHDARNMLTGIQQKYWAETLTTAVHAEIDHAKFPYAELDGHQLNIFTKSVKDFSRPWIISKYSVLCYRLEIAFSNIWYGFNDKYELTEKVVLEMYQACKQQGIPFLILGLDKSPSLVKLKSFAAARSIPLIDAGIDLYDPALNLQPHDAHPNAKAQQLYASQLIRAIRPYFSSKLSMLEK